MDINDIRNKKLLILKDFINTNKNLAKQGTPEWLNERQYIIGGSEIASIIGKNPFSNLQGVIAQKINLTNFNGNTACHWGNLFENVSELLFKTLFIKPDIKHHKIYATGSIQHSTIKNHRYSPDGLCCVLFAENDHFTYKTTLLEFKSPYSSVPAASVPQHYLPQIKAGLCTIDIAEVGIFVNNMFRKCSLLQMNYSIDYDNQYHKDTEKKLIGIDTAIAYGLIMFSINVEKLNIFMEKYNKINERSDSDSELESELSSDAYILTNKRLEFLSKDISSNDKFPDSDSDSDTKYFDDGTNILYRMYKSILIYQAHGLEKDKILNLNKNMINLGVETKELFNQFLALYKSDNNPFIEIKCIKPQLNKEAVLGNLTNFIVPNELNYIKSDAERICKKYNSSKVIMAFVSNSVNKQSVPIAYLPWKLLRSSNIIVEKDTGFLDNIKQEIDNCINIIKDIKSNSKNMDDTANIFEKYFENNTITKNYFERKPHTQDFLKDFI